MVTRPLFFLLSQAISNYTNTYTRAYTRKSLVDLYFLTGFHQVVFYRVRFFYYSKICDWPVFELIDLYFQKKKNQRKNRQQFKCDSYTRTLSLFLVRLPSLLHVLFGCVSIAWKRCAVRTTHSVWNNNQFECN